MPDVIYEMSKKGLGHTAVTGESDRLLGIISDGDLRRLFQREGNRALDLKAEDAMTRNPVTIGREELATKALNLMETRKITSLLVVDAEGKLEGAVHIHDLCNTNVLRTNILLKILSTEGRNAMGGTKRARVGGGVVRAPEKNRPGRGEGVLITMSEQSQRPGQREVFALREVGKASFESSLYADVYKERLLDTSSVEAPMKEP